ncbi:MAG: apolipoprotein N-acyltransferase [Verrucomicrobia bacterium]|nr:apolipoprotein N-acyltransferase [Verrucomicrobiota bacterium]
MEIFTTTRRKLVFAPRCGKLPPLKNFWHNPWSRRLLAVVAGLLLAAAFPKTGIAGFAWIAPAIMLAAAHGKSGGAAFRLGWLAGFAFALTSLYWLLLIPVKWFPILGWVALSAYVALYPAIWVWLVSSFEFRVSSWSARLRWSLGGAAAWVALELLRSRFLSGFPWNLLGTSQYELAPLIQIASVTGVYGVSFLVVWVSLALHNAVLAIVRQPTRRLAWQAEIILPLAVVVGIFAFGYARLREPNPPDRWLRVTVVQPSIPQTMIWDTSENTNRFRQLLELSERALASETDLLVWPEAALPEFNEANYAAITNLIARHRVWMIFGADDVQANLTAAKYDVFNAAFLFSPAGEFVARYHKRNLVIFGEYIPLVRWLPFVKWFTPITGGFAAGTQPATFALENLSAKTSPLICFEDVFPHLARDAADDTDFLLNLTNDGWFGESAEQWQHAAAGVFRAVENGLPLLRSCNNGVTCWIDSRGRIRDVLHDKAGRVYGAGFVTMEIPLPAPGEIRTPAFYHRHGDVFGWACVGIAVVALAAQRFRRPRA